MKDQAWRARARRVLGTTEAVVTLALFALALPAIAYQHPDLIGMEAGYVVMSGSMTGTFEPGDLIFVDQAPISGIQVGEIITFRSSEDNGIYYTHRVAAIEETPDGRVFTTKGDANEDVDVHPVPAEDVVGTYAFRVPYYGRLLAELAGGPVGLGIVLVAGLVILLHQTWAISESLGVWQARRDAKRGPPPFDPVLAGIATDRASLRFRSF